MEKLEKLATKKTERETTTDYTIYCKELKYI